MIKKYSLASYLAITIIIFLFLLITWAGQYYYSWLFGTVFGN